jgi:hypothetical protein
MHTIILKFFPARLTNPDLDLRYILPDLLVKKSGGLIEDGGYDYEAETDTMLIYLLTEDLERAVSCITDVVEKTQVLGNDLRGGIELVFDS